jgi:hypothetical protein
MVRNVALVVIAMVFVGVGVAWGAGVIAGFVAAVFVVVSGLAVRYGELVATGQVLALQAGGIAPRRITRGVVVLAAILGAIGACAAIVFAPTAVRTGYLGYVFAAMQPAFVASAMLPVVKLRGGDGLSAAAIVLGAYATIVIVATIVGAALGWAQGLMWLAVAFAMFAGDRVAHGYADGALSRDAPQFGA